MYGLVLEGGGAKGSYQVGAWKALRELGIEINGISGTSVGALNGAIMVQDDFENCYDLWYNMSPSKVMSIEDKLMRKLLKLDITPENIQYIIHQLRGILGGKGIDITPLKKLLKDTINEDLIRKSNIDFGIVTVSLSERKPMELFVEDIPKGHLVNYLLASANLPVFKLERIDGKLYLDGGFYDNLPIRLLLSKGYRDLIVVRLYGFGRRRRIKEDGLNITYINPSEELGMSLDFTRDRARNNLNLGYYDTLKVFKELKGQRYYVESKKDEDFFMNFFGNLDKKKVIKIGKVLGIEDMSYRRMLFECIIPKLVELLGLDKDSTYEEIILGLYEKAAERQSVERFKVYSHDDFVDTVKTGFKPSGNHFSKKIPKILKQSDFILKTVKDNILDEIVDELFCKLK